MQHATCFRIKLLSVPPTQEAGLPWKIWVCLGAYVSGLEDNLTLHRFHVQDRAHYLNSVGNSAVNKLLFYI